MRVKEMHFIGVSARGMCQRFALGEWLSLPTCPDSTLEISTPKFGVLELACLTAVWDVGEHATSFKLSPPRHLLCADVHVQAPLGNLRV